MVNTRIRTVARISRAVAAAFALLSLVEVGFVAAQVPGVADAAAPAGADGKPWKEIEVPKELSARGSRERAQILRELPGIMRGDTTLDDTAKQVLDGYFVRIVFAEMTQVANLPRITEIRQTVRSRYIRSPFAPPAVHTYINGLIFTNMNRIAHDNEFHPAVRVNAMYMIADLNEEESTVAGGAIKPAKPLAAVLSARGGLLDSAADATLLPAVRAMALYGVQRHADAGIAAANQAAAQTNMTAILKEKLTGTADAQTAWLKMRAADVLGTIGVADPAGAIAGALGATISDATAPVAVRCAAAQALGKLKGLAAGMIDLPELVAGLGNLHLDLCRAELDRAAFDLDTVSARQIHHRASAVQAALGDGAANGVVILVPAGDAQKALLDAIAANVTETLALVPDENADPTEQLSIKADELEKLLADANVLKSQPRATAAPADAPATTPTTTPASAAADGASKVN